MDDTRTRLLLGEELTELQKKTVCILGLGRVGSYLLETLARIGFKRFIVVDSGLAEDPSNALYGGEIRKKAELAKARIDEINEDAEVIAFDLPYEKSMLAGADVVADTLPEEYVATVAADCKESNIEAIHGISLRAAYDPAEIKLKKAKSLQEVFPICRALSKQGLGDAKILYSNTREEKLYYPSLAGLVFGAELVGALIGAKTEG